MVRPLGAGELGLRHFDVVQVVVLNAWYYWVRWAGPSPSLMWLWISNSLEKHASQSKEESSHLLPRYKWMHRWDSMSSSSFFSWNQHITKYVYEAIPDGLAQTREPHHTWSSYQVYTISLIHGPGKCCGTIIGKKCLNETVNSSSVTALKLKCLES